jgi:hypothetical protein
VLLSWRLTGDPHVAKATSKSQVHVRGGRGPSREFLKPLTQNREAVHLALRKSWHPVHFIYLRNTIPAMFVPSREFHN